MHGFNYDKYINDLNAFVEVMQYIFSVYETSKSGLFLFFWQLHPKILVSEFVIICTSWILNM